MDLGTIRWGVEVDTDQLDEARRRMDEMRRASGGARGGIDDVDRASRRARSSVGALAKVAGSLATAFAAFAGAHAFMDAVTTTQSLERGFTAVTGSLESARKEMAYAAEISDHLGLAVVGASEAYLSLSAAAKGTTLEGQASRDIFEAVATAMGSLGKSSADTRGALLAIEQMISKGVVSAEELRGQLGERLPGAFQAAARAMGVTTEALGDMLQRGEVAAEDMLPALARELNRLYHTGERISTLTAEWNRLGNAVIEFYRQLDETYGITDLLTRAIATLTSWVELLTDAIASGEFDQWLSTMTSVGGAAAAGVISFEMLTGALEGAASAHQLLNAVVRANPYVIAASAVAALTTGLYLARNETISLGDTTASVGHYIVSAWDVTRREVEEAFAAMRSSSDEAGAGMAGDMSGHALSVLGIWGRAFDSLLDLTRNGINGMLTLFVGLGRSIGQVAAAVVEAWRRAFANISDLAAAAWQDITTGDLTFGATRGAISSAVRGEIEQLQLLGSELAANFDGVTDYIGGAADATSRYLRQIAEEAEQNYNLDKAFEEANKVTDEHERALRRMRIEAERAAAAEAKIPLALPKAAGSGAAGKRSGGASDVLRREFNDLLKALRSEEQIIEDSYRRRLAIVLANTEAGSAAQEALIAKVSALREQDLAELERQREAERDSLMRGLLTQEEELRRSYERRREEILAATAVTEQERQELLRRLNEQFIEEMNGSDYWSKWLESAEESLTSLDELAGSTLENLSASLGSAIEQMIFDAKSLDEALVGLINNIGRAVVRALGEMAAQQLALLAVQALTKSKTQASGAMTMALNAQAQSVQAGLAAYASTAAIPIVGPSLAPAAAAAAQAATQPMAQAVGALAMAGIAHSGIDRVPREGTWLLDRGERVVSAPQADKLDRFLSQQGAAEPTQINITNNYGRGVDIDARQSADGRTIEIAVEQSRRAVARDLQSGGNPVARAAESAYGLKRGKGAMRG